MKDYTLGFLFKKDKIILAKKKRKIGVGKWNGYGGKIHEGETKTEAMVREFKEECEADIKEEDCNELGRVEFSFENQEGIGQNVFIYRIDSFSGEPKETEEMGEPMEFDVKDIPYNEMMLGDDKFVPFIVEGKKFFGRMHYSENGEEILECKIEEIKDEKTREFKLK